MDVYTRGMNATPAVAARLRDYFLRHGSAEGLAAAYLFGSVARGTAHANSDVDAGVLYVDDLEPCLRQYRQAVTEPRK
jgi:predicted nucleotidyltransferase